MNPMPTMNAVATMNGMPRQPHRFHGTKLGSCVFPQRRPVPPAALGPLLAFGSPIGLPSPRVTRGTRLLAPHGGNSTFHSFNKAPLSEDWGNGSKAFIKQVFGSVISAVRSDVPGATFCRMPAQFICGIPGLPRPNFHLPHPNFFKVICGICVCPRESPT